MDLNQRKLNKSEWDSIEVPVSPQELEVLKLIQTGYNNVSIKFNKHNSLFTFLKIEYAKNMEDYLYNKFFAPLIEEIITKHNATFLRFTINAKATINKADSIRIERNNLSKLSSATIYELLLIEYIEQVLKYKTRSDAQSKESKKKTDENKWMCNYYTLYKLLQNSVLHVNENVLKTARTIITEYETDINYAKIISNSAECIEHNSCLLKYADSMLYKHQKDVFTIMKTPNPKLVLYIAPTGTGKTLTPIGLSESHKIIFVCAARHVGLALSRAAISVDKKVAFAFGCNSADDIRLHYFAAKEFTINRRSGGIRKVDNSVGDKVEIMICDIKSYICAMYYMLAFNEKEKIITYWDEPTITFDYATHDFHEIIHKNWRENIIPNMVLSSATLPKLHELTETVADFSSKFPESVIHNVVSHDCRKSIPIINNDGYIVMPHLLSTDYTEVLRTVEHCENYLTILRYFDLNECAKFIEYVDTNNYIPRNMKIERQFGSLDDVSMQNIKLYYLKLLKNIMTGTWGAVCSHFRNERVRKIQYNVGIDSKGNKIKKASSVGPGTNISPSGLETSKASGGKQLSRTMSVQLPHTQSTVDTTVPTAPGLSGSCGVYVTTKDAYTLTDGPTIFLANDVEKIAKFCIQQANIPSVVMTDIMDKIDQNNIINEKLAELERSVEDILEKDSEPKDEKGSKGGKSKGGNDKKIERLMSGDKSNETVGLNKLKEQIENLTGMIKTASLNNVFVPNKLEHIEKWAEDMPSKAAFTSDIEDSIIIKIMLLNGIEDSWKVLLLMGIGVFTNHENIAYTEIMKTLADQQKLFLIISSSDYIYGTNYQFCHGYISKDLNLTQEKIIQAMGRIGRNNIQQNYSVRCRDEDHITKLFTLEVEKPEVINMNILFNSKKVVYNGSSYVVVEPQVL
jgi:hypothetical protein